ncbi:PREDICTED: pectinesterase inhibitor 2-like [Tarenaya hassleriana]|uniref:pectinesterase inhibitor 2-like n=1 Tax=Tarenaya hassleriana TaxID=28532 RepID=UPI00053C9061|nr:PREDICTED: pectinesterase inhibitor 2-like [Tarenaya hassleriana]
MASNLKTNFLMAPLAVFLFLVVSSSARLTIKPLESEIEHICSGATNPEVCLKFLKSKPETAKADLLTLAKLVIDSVRQIATETRKHIDSNIEKATDVTSKGVYKNISGEYGHSLAYLGDALKALARGDGETLNIIASGVMNQALNCMDNFAAFKVSPDPSSIIEEMKYLYNVSDILLSISNMI